MPGVLMLVMLTTLPCAEVPETGMRKVSLLGVRTLTELPPTAAALPHVKHTVTLRIDQDVLDFFQEGGPGWQDRINAALRKAAGK